MHKHKRGRDPAKTTCRDNPKGGPSPALTRASNMCVALERRATRMRAKGLTPVEKEEMIRKTMLLVEELKRR